MSLVTVLLLTYNQEKTLARAFDSILEQKTRFDFEIHVLEDCSTDGTAEACRAYQNRYPGRIKLFLNEKNVGVSGNLKQGILRVQSPYYAFLEGDDYWVDPGKLQLQVDALELHPECTLCGHNTLFRNVSTGEERPFIPPEDNKDSGVYKLGDGLSIHPSSRMYRNCVDMTNVPEFMVLDTHIYMIYLTNGDLFYINKTMSVYNNTGTGYWSGRTKKNKKYTSLKLIRESNEYFQYKHESFHYRHSKLLKTLKGMLGIRHGWEAFYFLEGFRLRLKYILEKPEIGKSGP
ncbi:MAG: glycosyltransferase family 2 protein [bacterium]|jgi:glycosyltransferase involved in cell wall biosynthesis